MKDMNVYKVNVKCHACGKDSPFTMHTLIDTAKDPNAETKLFQGEYFNHVCPICHQVQPVTYSCMYHDGKRKLLIGFADSEKDYSMMKETLAGTKKSDKLDEVLAKWLETCEVRIVRSEYALQEKVLIAHFGLDDRIIEIARYRVRKALQKDRKDIVDLYFNTQGNAYVFLIATETDMSETYTFTKEMYDELANTYQKELQEDMSIEVDQKWAEKIVENHA